MIALTAAERKAVYHALHHFTDADRRWARLGPAPTDAQIRAALSFEFGISGGCGGPAEAWADFHGGANPWLTLDHRRHFRGKRLIELVRQVLDLERPEDRGVLGAAIFGRP